MSLNFASIASGSNGNCYYIANESDAIFIDAGISCRQTEQRMKRLGLEIENIKAIFISHEHSDHTYGATVLSKKYDIPVYISEPTFSMSKITLTDKRMMPIMANWPIQIGSLQVKAFTKMHDASDPMSFIVSNGDKTIGVLTDIGTVDPTLIENFALCQAAFLETNYDDEMLVQGRYPAFLKQRISGSHGHLSNLQAFELFQKHRHPELTHVIFSHISKDNNHPRKVIDLFSQDAVGIRMKVASRERESEVFGI